MARLNEARLMYKIRLNNSVPLIVSDRQLKSIEEELRYANVCIEVHPLGANNETKHNN